MTTENEGEKAHPASWLRLNVLWWPARICQGLTFGPGRFLECHAAEGELLEYTALAAVTLTLN